MAKIIFLPRSGNIILNEPNADSLTVYPVIINHTMDFEHGVYKWFYNEKDEVPIYVGKSAVGDTFLRGVSEAFRLPFSTDKQGGYGKLDTDYIVGTVLKILTFDYGKTCYWKHIDPNPKNERKYLTTLLQTNKSSDHIDKKWRLERKEDGYWGRRTTKKIEESEQGIKALLDEILKSNK